MTALVLKESELMIAPILHKAAIYIRHLLPAAYFKAMVVRARDTKPKTE